MAKRTAMISPFQMLAMDTHNKILNIPEIGGIQPTLNSHNLFYSTLIQAGLDEIIVQSDFESYVPVSDVILERVKPRNSDNWLNAHALIESTFNGLIDTTPKDEKHAGALLKLKLFLSDLLAALADRNSIIMVIPMPEIDILKEFLPPELFIPIKNLFSCLQQIEPIMATPRIDILRDDVGRFQEVLSSSTFNNYVSQQSKLDNSSADIQVASHSISNAAIQLCKKYKRTLITERVASILLPISSKSIDTVLGALPGKIAESTCSAAENWLSQNKRLSIYNLDPVAIEILQSRLTKTIRAKLHDDNS